MENIIIDHISFNPQYAVEARSSIGGRSEQQDRAYACCDSHGIFALVCDGMGGTEDGEMASETTVSTVRQAYKEYLTNRNDMPTSFLYQAMVAADKEVSERIDNKTGGTTMVAVLISDALLYWISVGDSRLYILREGELLQVTRDHNYLLRLNELKSQGRISDNYFQSEAVRGDALISYIGLGNIDLFDLTQSGFELRHGDRILLTTDGLFRIVPSELIQSIMDSKEEIALRADNLLNEVSKQSDEQAQDNTTFILIDAV